PSPVRCWAPACGSCSTAASAANAATDLAPDPAGGSGTGGDGGEDVVEVVVGELRVDGQREHVLGQVVGDGQVDRTEAGEDRLPVRRREVEASFDTRGEQVVAQAVAVAVDQRGV